MPAAELRPCCATSAPFPLPWHCGGPPPPPTPLRAPCASGQRPCCGSCHALSWTAGYSFPRSGRTAVVPVPLAQWLPWSSKREAVPGAWSGLWPSCGLLRGGNATCGGIVRSSPGGSSNSASNSGYSSTARCGCSPILSPETGEKGGAPLDLVAGLVSVTMTCPVYLFAGLHSLDAARDK